jgi:hypothetical protein
MNHQEMETLKENFYPQQDQTENITPDSVEWTQIKVQDLNLIQKQIKSLTLQVQTLQTELSEIKIKSIISKMEISERLTLLESQAPFSKSMEHPRQQTDPLGVSQQNASQKGSQISYANTLMKNLPCPSSQKSQAPNEEFVQVWSKRNRRDRKKEVENAPRPPVQPSLKVVARPLREAIKTLSSNEEILQKLTSSPENPPPVVIPEKKKEEEVSSVYFQSSLSREAAKDPLFSFMKVFEAVTGLKPLGISLMSKTVAEIFVPTSTLNDVRSKIPPQMIVSTPRLSMSDVKRRAASYNRGFFKGLRRASLEGLNNGLQLQLLSTAEASISNLPFHRQKWVQKAITEDRLWVASQ